MGLSQAVGIIFLLGVAFLIGKVLIDMVGGRGSTISRNKTPAKFHCPALMLSYYQGEPCFRIHDLISKGLILSFSKVEGNTNLITFRLVKGKSGWHVVMEFSQAFQGKRRPSFRFPRKINALADTLNACLEIEIPYEIGQELATWEVQADHCAVMLEPPVINLNPPPRELKVELAFREGIPVFKQGAYASKSLILSFGEVCEGDYGRSMVTFFIMIKLTHAKWQASIKGTEIWKGWGWVVDKGNSDGSHYTELMGETLRAEREPAVLEMIAQCNAAIQKGEATDLAPFKDHWQQEDQSFEMRVDHN